jgi:hypothetical protein
MRPIPFFSVEADGFEVFALLLEVLSVEAGTAAAAAAG